MTRHNASIVKRLSWANKGEGERSRFVSGELNPFYNHVYAPAIDEYFELMKMYAFNKLG